MENNASRLLNATRLKLASEYHEALANLQVFLSNPSGVADHPDITGQITEFIRKASGAKDALALLDSLEIQSEND